ncbi:uncharacterized protein LOC132199581 [Neocloeon triangulifer]|uniref:uncharacterized protein LOC132199581 n=1 Tax=Neocloeon triangulifer TaxID=2078957 RepID=UPI00286F8E03|nr:uncharacterized protein LOC132199581 [Neocloeon triangulifer]
MKEKVETCERFEIPGKSIIQSDFCCRYLLIIIAITTAFVLLCNIKNSTNLNAKEVELEHSNETNEILQRLIDSNKEIQEDRKIPENQFNELKTFMRCLRASLMKLTTASNGKKYLFYNQTKMTWDDAYLYCEKRGLHLATAKNLEDLYALRMKTKSFINHYERWWLSAKDYGNITHHDYRWHDGTPFHLNDTLWKTHGQIDHNTCPHVYFASAGELNKILCIVGGTLPKNFVCELYEECY